MTAVTTIETCGELIVTEGAAGFVTLNRSKPINVISGRMRAEIAEAIPRFARDPNVYALIVRSAAPETFAAGRDLYDLNQGPREEPELARTIFRDECALCWLLECFSKPTVSLIDGLVAGLGAGLTLYGTHRVAGENYTFAVLDGALGLVPGNGLAWVLARMPGQTGVYLGLTGRPIARADAYRLGLVTHCIPAARFGEIEEGLRSADPVDTVLDERHVDPGSGELEPYREVLDHCFEPATVEEIFGRLSDNASKSGAEADWCAGVLSDLTKRSPIALKLTLRHIRDAAHRDLRQTLMVDYRLACNLIGTHDFHEEITSRLGHHRPRWSPSALADVTDAMVDRFFAYQPSRELILPTRQEMQAARI